MWSFIMDSLKDNFMHNEAVKMLLPNIQEKVKKGAINPTVAGEELLGYFYKSVK